MEAIGDNASKQLRSIVDRIERLEEEKAALGNDIKDIYTEAKSNGYDVRVLRLLIRERKKDASTQAELNVILEIYRAALGDYASTPLAQAMEPGR